MVDAKWLITSKMVGEELRFQMSNAGFWTDPPSVTHRYCPRNDQTVTYVSCGGCSATLYLPTSDLALSMDNFSAKHIAPVIEELKRMRGSNG
jgi:hypothetical protein